MLLGHFSTSDSSTESYKAICTSHKIPYLFLVVVGAYKCFVRLFCSSFFSLFSRSHNKSKKTGKISTSSFFFRFNKKNNRFDFVVVAFSFTMDPPRRNLPDILLATVRDGVVAKKTNAQYVCQIFMFLYYLLKSGPHCLTDHARAFLNNYRITYPALSQSRLQTRVKTLFQAELRGAKTNPVVVLDLITPDLFMEYIFTLRHSRIEDWYLSKSAYGNRRASLFHLFRLHNNTGFSEAFKLELNNLFRGFFRVLVQDNAAANERLVAVNVDNDDIEENIAAVVDDDAAAAAVGPGIHQWNADELKKGMSVESCFLSMRMLFWC